MWRDDPGKNGHAERRKMRSLQQWNTGEQPYDLPKMVTGILVVCSGRDAQQCVLPRLEDSRR